MGKVCWRPSTPKGEKGLGIAPNGLLKYWQKVSPRRNTSGLILRRQLKGNICFSECSLNFRSKSPSNFTFHGFAFISYLICIFLIGCLLRQNFPRTSERVIIKFPEFPGVMNGENEVNDNENERCLLGQIFKFLIFLVRASGNTAENVVFIQ